MLNHKGTEILETNRLILKRFSLKDLDNVYINYASDDIVTKYLPWARHENLSRTERQINFWINSYKEKCYYNWAIFYKENAQVIGSINLLNVDNYNENCEIGYCLGKKFWDNGIMTEAVNRILQFAFDEIGFERITARIHIKNISSSRVIKKCKFSYEGTLRNILKDTNGEFFDCKYYSILKDEYKKY